MKLRTHYVFSSGLLTLLNVMAMHSFYPSLFIAGVISVIGNMVIDGLGHEIKGGFIRRTPRTHTVPRSVLWGLVSTMPVLLFIYYVSYHGYYYDYYSYYSVDGNYLVATLIDGIVVGPSHMLLDVFTEKGIYVKENGVWRRFALAHFKFDDPVANGLAALIGIAMLFAAMQMQTNFFYYYYHY